MSYLQAENKKRLGRNATSADIRRSLWPHALQRKVKIAIKEISDLSSDVALATGGFFCNSYNVVEIKNKKIDARLKIVGGGFVDFKEAEKRREIL